MRSITLNGPAKINLYLDVINKRSDGFHNIVTIFQRINLYDSIKVSIIPRGVVFNCSYPHLPKGPANIAFKAARLMIKEFNLSKGVRLALKKRIPVAAGLGGGSSDAASVILGINKLFGLKATPGHILRLAKTIGADVPFFISGYSCAVGRGVGDRLKEVSNSLSFYILLLTPNIRVYTKTIYNRVRLPLTKPAVNVNILARILAGKCKDEALASSLYNRFEEIVFPLYPIIKKAKEEMSLYTDRVLLSGSGPTIFGLFSVRKEAIEAAKKIRREGKWQTVLTKVV